MLIDWLVYGALTWGVAFVLNATMFKDQPASRFAAWSLTVIAFFVNLVALTVLQYFRFRAISNELGVDIKPPGPVDGIGALAFSWLLFGLLRKGHLATSARKELPQAHNDSKSRPASTRNPTPVATDLPARTASTPQTRQEATTMTKVSALHHPETEEDFWAAALQEVDGPTRRAGLWAKAFALANGNEAEAKAAYLRERVLQIEQESKEAVEQQERQLAEVAERERQAFRKQLGENGAELLDCIQYIKLNPDNIPTKVLINVVRLLGGRVEWGSTGILSSGWIVAIKGNSIALRDDGELSMWFLKAALPMAEAAFPHQLLAIPIGSCPSCNATISLNAVSCLGCQATFGPDSAWKPIPCGEA